MVLEEHRPTPEEILKKLQELIGEQFATAPEEITMETSFEEDLGADSVPGRENQKKTQHFQKNYTF